MILGSPGKVGRCQIYAHQSRDVLVGFFFAAHNSLFLIVSALFLSHRKAWSETAIHIGARYDKPKDHKVMLCLWRV